MKNILVEESYTGLLVNHRTETHEGTVTPVPEDEQYRHENFFPVIIDRVECEQVQKLTIHYNCVGAIFVPNIETLPVPAVTVNTRKGVFVNYAPCQITE